MRTRRGRPSMAARGGPHRFASCSSINTPASCPACLKVHRATERGPENWRGSIASRRSASQWYRPAGLCLAALPQCLTVQASAQNEQTSATMPPIARAGAVHLSPRLSTAVQEQGSPPGTETRTRHRKAPPVLFAALREEGTDRSCRWAPATSDPPTPEYPARKNLANRSVLCACASDIYTPPPGVYLGKAWPNQAKA